MAANNINKIVRGNLNLKPWILSKNPSDIVNSYVEKLYKQIPNNFKNDLIKPRIAVTQPENRARLRTFKAPVERISFPIISKPKPKLQSHCYRSPPMTAKNSFVNAVPTKLLKSPNFKIYSRRKYASSASSSNASFLRNDSEERRKKLYKPTDGIQFRTFTGTAAGKATLPAVDCFNSPGIAKYIAPTRLYNDLNNQVKCLEITSAICKDLMSVNDMLKRKIRVNRPKTPGISDDIQPSGKESIDMSFKGWNHPSVEHLNKLTATPVIKKPPVVNKQYFEHAVPALNLISMQRLTLGGKTTNYGTTPRRENARYQAANITPYRGFTNEPYAFAATPEPEPQPDPQPVPKPPVEPPKNPKAHDPREFVCRSRAPRNARTISQKSLKSTTSKLSRRF